jgi:hypothetical protein
MVCLLLISLIPRQVNPGTHLVGWLDLIASGDILEEGEVCCLC